ncbi:MAG: MmgE/PrpD family protein [Tissierella sp.]|nr:MmgE/PrpD family protein [Tissierella sp.]
MNELEQLSRFIVDLKFEDIPLDVVESTKLCVLDSYAVAAGASKDKMILSIVNEYKSYYPDGDDVSIWGMDIKMPLVQAVFLNSLMGHRLELDDVHTKSKTHIGTIVVPTALCLAQYLKSSGKQFLEAVLCGYEIMSRIGIAFGVSSHRNKGWHVTSTAGTFGAAATASKLLNLNFEQTLYALGMAGTQSFGLWAFLEDGSSSKILHPARASSSGLESAILSKSGMTGPKNILNAKDGGLLKAMSDEYDLSMVTNDLGTIYEIQNVDNKPYPCCRSTHCAIDSAIYLKKQYDINVDLIDEIVVDTYLVGYKQCGLTDSSLNPKTPVEAKFSIPYTVATALISGNVTLEDFSMDKIGNKEVQSLLRKVKVRPKDVFTNRYPNHWGCGTKIKMKNEDEFRVEIQDALGSVYNPISKKEIRNKVIPLLEVVSSDTNMDVIDTILAIEKLDNLSNMNL